MQTGRHFVSSSSEVNSTGYPEFDEPISARHQRYPLSGDVGSEVSCTRIFSGTQCAVQARGGGGGTSL